MSNIKIPVSKPWVTNLEREYLLKAFDSNQFSRGYYVEMFEKKFAEYLGVKHVLGTSSGSTACHLAVLTSGIHPYYKICIPNLTFIATPNSVVTGDTGVYLGEVNANTWNLDEELFIKNKMYEKVKGIFLVDLLGNPVNIERWYKIAKQYKLVLIHDACEALGAEISYAGKKYKCGNLFVRSSVFSFYPNKNIIAAGEGGALATNNDDVYEKAKLLHGQYQHHQKRYYHENIGYNYRMSNLSGAVLCAQLERINEILEQKERVYKEYMSFFTNTHIKMQTVNTDYRHSYWAVGVKLKNKKNVEYELNKAGIETRSMFVPISLNPPYEAEKRFDISEDIYNNVLILPSFCELSNENIKEICEIVERADKA